MGAVDRECPAGHSGGRPVGHRDGGHGHRSLFVAVPVEGAAATLHDRLQILVDRVHRARGVHPPRAVVEPLVDEELSPRHRPIRIEAFVAHHLRLGPEKERRVRVDEQQGAVVESVRRCDSDAVRARGLVGFAVSPLRRSIGRGVSVKRRELVEIDAFDVPADAAFAERERHPRLELRDDPGLHVRMLVQVEIQAVGPRVHQPLEPFRARRVPCPHRVGVDEQLHAQVLVDPRLALGFRQPPHRVQVVGLDAIEVVLSLRVDQAEHRVSVGLAVDVGDAPIIPEDGDVLRLSLPTSDVLCAGAGRRREGDRGQAHCGSKHGGPVGSCCAGRRTRRSPRPRRYGCRYTEGRARSRRSPRAPARAATTDRRRR